MSQVFGADSVNVSTSTTVITTSETSAATGNFLNPPFGNAKAIVSATVQINPGTATTALAIKLRRNPNGENLQIGGVGGVAAAAGTNVVLGVTAADAIPDGRPVQYSVTVTQTGASGNGTIFYANVSAMLISG